MSSKQLSVTPFNKPHQTSKKTKKGSEKYLRGDYDVFKIVNWETEEFDLISFRD
jgi:hypothetical protein